MQKVYLYKNKLLVNLVNKKIKHQYTQKEISEKPPRIKRNEKNHNSLLRSTLHK